MSGKVTKLTLAPLFPLPGQVVPREETPKNTGTLYVLLANAYMTTHEKQIAKRREKIQEDFPIDTTTVLSCAQRLDKLLLGMDGTYQFINKYIDTSTKRPLTDKMNALVDDVRDIFQIFQVKVIKVQIQDSPTDTPHSSSPTLCSSSSLSDDLSSAFHSLQQTKSTLHQTGELLEHVIQLSEENRWEEVSKLLSAMKPEETDPPSSASDESHSTSSSSSSVSMDASPSSISHKLTQISSHAGTVIQQADELLDTLSLITNPEDEGFNRRWSAIKPTGIDLQAKDHKYDLPSTQSSSSSSSSSMSSDVSVPLNPSPRLNHARSRANALLQMANNLLNMRSLVEQQSRKHTAKYLSEQRQEILFHLGEKLPRWFAEEMPLGDRVYFHLFHIVREEKQRRNTPELQRFGRSALLHQYGYTCTDAQVQEAIQRTSLEVAIEGLTLVLKSCKPQIYDGYKKEKAQPNIKTLFSEIEELRTSLLDYVPLTEKAIDSQNDTDDRVLLITVQEFKIFLRLLNVRISAMKTPLDEYYESGTIAAPSAGLPTRFHQDKCNHETALNRLIYGVIDHWKYK